MLCVVTITDTYIHANYICAFFLMPKIFIVKIRTNNTYIERIKHGKDEQRETSCPRREAAGSESRGFGK